ncbi:tRNA synthetase class II core domain (G, h, p, S and t) domain-containing protein [Phthorimaea operculella]|nr:tRNA synthetase class II core domain (G, h, p, S and t) domain-containing protein [Phthorimaea operculella]
MRYVSQLFQPLITVPKNAKIKNTEITCKSQKLLLECGLVRPTSSGLFSLLPLAQRALDKLENLVRSHLDAIGGQRITLPCLAAESLWERSGRLQEVGPELMTMTDRHQKRYLLAPTHEEGIADLLADVAPISYKQLPLLLYQIGPKYRDEHRPKHGLLRAREFRMLDAYGAHATRESAEEMYQKVTNAYRRLFETLHLPVYRVEAPTGEMGGSLSHEWQLRAPAGEDAIDIWHTFILGTKYSEALQAHFTPPGGQTDPLIMSCYGIGLTRLLAASVEALSSEVSLRWARAIAPFSAIVIGPKAGSKEWQPTGWESLVRLAERLELALGDEVLMDDRHALTIGKRLLFADKMGYPHIVVCGRHALDTPPRYELRGGGGGGVTLHTPDELVDAIAEKNSKSDDLKTEIHV